MRGKRKAIWLRKILRDMTPAERRAVLTVALSDALVLAALQGFTTVDLSKIVDDPAWWGLE